MRKTSVYLPDDLKEALAREAARRGASEAEVIRAAVRDAVVRPLPTTGLFEAEPFAERVDELLEGFGER
jgi:predicted transcriptional regulator